MTLDLSLERLNTNNIKRQLSTTDRKGKLVLKITSCPDYKEVKEKDGDNK